MRLVVFAVAAVLLTAPAAEAELWKYEDESGGVNFTDEFAKVPLEYRHTARKHVIQDAGAAPADGGVAAIMKERERVIDGFSAAQAKEAVAKGLLTVDEVNRLVQKGVLRSSELGDQYRFAGKAAPAPSAAPAASRDEAQPELTAAERDLKMLQELSTGNLARAAQARSVMDDVEAIKNSPKFKYAMIGEGVLALLLIAGMPFVMRRYNDDGTRRIIRASFFFSFIIISATGNMLLFKDEVAGLLEMKNTAENAGSSAAGPAAEPASLQGKPWQPESAAPANP